MQPNGYELRGTFVVNEVDSTYLLVSIDEKPSNTIIAGRTTIDAIIDPIETKKIISMGIEMANNKRAEKPYNVGVIQT
jgi:acetyl-CoA carboxylase carboxyltransferase component